MAKHDQRHVQHVSAVVIIIHHKNAASRRHDRRCDIGSHVQSNDGSQAGGHWQAYRELATLPDPWAVGADGAAM